MTKSRFLVSLMSVAMLAAPLLASSLAFARSQAAVLGHERFGRQAACFDEYHGGPYQNGSGSACASRVQWVIPIVYDNAGNANIRVSAQGNGSGTRNVECTAYSATSAGALTTGTTARTVRNDRATEYLTSSVYANGFGGTWVACGMDPTTWLFNVHY